jgi:hypothetical protein
LWGCASSSSRHVRDNKHHTLTAAASNELRTVPVGAQTDRVAEPNLSMSATELRSLRSGWIPTKSSRRCTCWHCVEA